MIPPDFISILLRRLKLSKIHEQQHSMKCFTVNIENMTKFRRNAKNFKCFYCKVLISLVACSNMGRYANKPLHFIFTFITYRTEFSASLMNIIVHSICPDQITLVCTAGQ